MNTAMHPSFLPIFNPNVQTHSIKDFLKIFMSICIFPIIYWFIIIIIQMKILLTLIRTCINRLCNSSYPHSFAFKIQKLNHTNRYLPLFVYSVNSNQKINKKTTNLEVEMRERGCTAETGDLV